MVTQQLFCDVDIPQLPNSVMLTPGSTSIMVSWMQPPYSPSHYTVSYTCRLLCDILSTTQGSVNITSATTHTFSSFAPGSACTISVVAVYDGIGMSNTLTLFTNTLTPGKILVDLMAYNSSPAPTGAPDGLTSSSVESRSLTVQWGTVPCPNQRGPITGYRLRYSNGTSIVDTTDLTHMLTGLTPFTSYSVQVAAVNAGGTGPYSTALTVETLQDSE